MGNREVIKVPLDQLFPDPTQVRREFSAEGLSGLAQSLLEGQLHPILVYRKDNKYVILDGERRWRAAKLVSLPTLDAIVVEEPGSVGALVQRQLIADIQRQDLTPMERARAIERFMTETRCTAVKAARALGLSEASISRYRALLSLPEEAQAKVETGELAATTAYALTRGASTVKEEPPRARRQRKCGGQPPQTGVVKATATLGGGRSVALSGPGLATIDHLVQWLEELLAKARKVKHRGVELATFLALLKDEAKAAEGGKPC